MLLAFYFDDGPMKEAHHPPKQKFTLDTHPHNELIELTIGIRGGKMGT